MSICDFEGTANYISNWISDYARKAGVKTLVLGLSGGIDSALVALLCKRTGLPLVCVNMPCHSTSTAYSRAAEFAKEQGIPLFKVDLSASHEMISAQFSSQVKNGFVVAPMEFDFEGKGSSGGLRSCLRAPTLSFLAHATNGVIVGTGNRSEDNLLRYFQKYGDGSVDISPISDLFKSEVRELFAYLSGLQDNNKDLSGAKSIYDAVPSADLWGQNAGQEDEKELGINYDEIEWADRLNMQSNIISDDADPSKNSAWQGLTARQKVVVAKMHAMEKSSRHKYNPGLPSCLVRNVPGLVR